MDQSEFQVYICTYQRTLPVMVCHRFHQLPGVKICAANQSPCCDLTKASVVIIKPHCLKRTHTDTFNPRQMKGL